MAVPLLINLVPGITQTQITQMVEDTVSAQVGVFKTDGSPEGVVACPTGIGLAYDPATGALYAFNGVAEANTGWVAIINPAT
jgi:hypothetical protein